MAKDFRAPDLCQRLVGLGEYVALNSSHIQLLPLNALKKELWNFEIYNACPQADDFDGKVFPMHLRTVVLRTQRGSGAFGARLTV